MKHNTPKAARSFKITLAKLSFCVCILGLTISSCSKVSISNTFVDVHAKSAIPFKFMKGSGKYGFGICKAGTEVADMQFNPNYEEIAKFKLFLKHNGHTNIERAVVDIEQSMESGNSEKYANAVEKYYTEIEKLSDPEGLFQLYNR